VIYQIIGVVAVALAVAGSVWWVHRVRDRAGRAPAIRRIRDHASHQLDRIRRAGL